MRNRERELSTYIDKMNDEKKPEVHGMSREDAELYSTVRLVRSLRAPVLPEDGYGRRLARNVAKKISGRNSRQGRTRRLKIGMAAAAAILTFVLLLNFIGPLGGGNIVSAMEKAFEDVRAYHGILEISELNQQGDKFTQARVEVWKHKDGRYYVKHLDGVNAGIITVNNGSSKWQIRPAEKKAYIFSAFPDPYVYSFELGKEIEDVRNAIEIKAVGEDTIAGRKTSVLEITPKGGSPYRLWIDSLTKLPLQKESAMQNALQYRVTYTEISFDDTIPDKLMTYGLPEGFKEIETVTEQVVSNVQEAFDISGFLPDIPDDIPGYRLEGISVEMNTKAVKLSYVSLDGSNKVAYIKNEAKEDFSPASTAVMGNVGNSAAEIQSPVRQELGILATGPYAGVSDISSIRWQQEGFEYAVVGEISLEDLAKFVNNLKKGDVRIPGDKSGEFNPQVEVPVDMEIERNEQKSADGGHSPWRLDPEFVAQVFVSLKISPQGITGDYPVSEEQLETVYNTGTEAIVEISGDVTPVRRVYLKRLIRRDSTGVWTVVGYDPAE